MKKITKYFLSIFSSLLIMLLFFVLNDISDVETDTDYGVNTGSKHSGYKLDNTEGCILGPESAATSEAYYVDVPDLTNAIFVPADTAGELNSFIAAASGLSVEVCQGDSSAYEGAPFSDSDSGCGGTFTGDNDKWDLNCDGAITMKYPHGAGSVCRAGVSIYCDVDMWQGFDYASPPGCGEGPYFRCSGHAVPVCPTSSENQKCN